MPEDKPGKQKRKWTARHWKKKEDGEPITAPTWEKNEAQQKSRGPPPGPQRRRTKKRHAAPMEARQRRANARVRKKAQLTQERNFIQTLGMALHTTTGDYDR